MRSLRAKNKTLIGLSSGEAAKALTADIASISANRTAPAGSGTSSSGSFLQTMVLTDIATGWTECVPVRTRDSGNVIVAMKQASSRFPFPLLGVDFDNDSAFMNAFVVSWCRSEGLEVTRSRAYRKNDQAHVEQKNGAIVRRLVGYGRFVGMDATAALRAAGEGAHRWPCDQALSSSRPAGRPCSCAFRCDRSG